MAEQRLGMMPMTNSWRKARPALPNRIAESSIQEVTTHTLGSRQLEQATFPIRLQRSIQMPGDRLNSLIVYY
jgi:hypothetical protein